MVQCAIEGCSSRSDTQPSTFSGNAVHFHRVPTNTQIRQKWMQAINKREVKTSTRVCSLHFKEENYYITEQGIHKLSAGSVPEIKLPCGEEVKEDSNSDEEMRTVLPPEPNISYWSQSQQRKERKKEKVFIATTGRSQTSTKEITPEIGKTVNVSGSSTNIKHVEDVMDDTTGSSSDEEISNVQPLEQNIIYQSQIPQTSTKEITQKIGTTDVLGSTKNLKHGHEVNGDTTDSSEDENFYKVQPQQQNINLPNQCKKNNSKEMTTYNVKELLEPGVQKKKGKTLLERKLLKEVRRLQEQGKKKLQAISCLLDQNRRLLHRNTFLEQELKKCEKVTQNVDNIA